MNTDDEMRVAIAEAMGWIDVIPARWSGYNKMWFPLSSPSDERPGLYYGYVPDYLTDLNAMHEAERGLTDDEHSHFRRNIQLITKRPNGFFNDRAWFSPSARQRALAFLAVKQPCGDGKEK